MGGGWVFALLVSLYGHLCWLSIALTVNPHIHYMKQLKHRYCCCGPLVVTFVCYEFGTLSCATKLEEVPHFWTKYSRDWKCSSVISPDDIWALICWHLSFWGCKGLLVSLYDNLTWPSEAVPFCNIEEQVFAPPLMYDHLRETVHHNVHRWEKRIQCRRSTASSSVAWQSMKRQ